MNTTLLVEIFVLGIVLGASGGVGYSIYRIDQVIKELRND